MKVWKKRAAVLFTMVALMWLTAAWGYAEEFARITPEALKKLLESADPSILIVDVQPKRVYDLGHIKKAIHFPWAADLKNAGDLPRNKTLVLYCDCTHEEDALDVATQLKEKWSYTNIQLLEGGWSTWQKLGYPIEK
jgi:hydroxyacylglutathione hydrolase